MDEMAQKAGTINYEMACGFGLRLERVYERLSDRRANVCDTLQAHTRLRRRILRD